MAQKAITNVEQKGRKLAEVEIINEIRRLPMNERNWDLMNRDQKREVLAMLKAQSNEITVTQVTDALFEVKEKYGLKAEVVDTPKAKSRRERRRKQRKMNENGKVERVLRGGDNTLILQNKEGEIVRFKVRKKGAPKYKDTGINKKAVFKTDDGEVAVQFVLNPKEGSDSKRVGFEWNEKWYILDNEEFHAKVEAFDNKRKNSFTILQPGTTIEVDAPEETAVEETEVTDAPKAEVDIDAEAEDLAEEEVEIDEEGDED